MRFYVHYKFPGESRVASPLFELLSLPCLPELQLLTPHSLPPTTKAPGARTAQKHRLDSVCEGEKQIVTEKMPGSQINGQVNI